MCHPIISGQLEACPHKSVSAWPSRVWCSFKIFHIFLSSAWHDPSETMRHSGLFSGGPCLNFEHETHPPDGHMHILDWPIIPSLSLSHYQDTMCHTRPPGENNIYNSGGIMASGGKNKAVSSYLYEGQSIAVEYWDPVFLRCLALVLPLHTIDYQHVDNILTRPFLHNNHSSIVLTYRVEIIQWLWPDYTAKLGSSIHRGARRGGQGSNGREYWGCPKSTLNQLSWPSVLSLLTWSANLICFSNLSCIAMLARVQPSGMSLILARSMCMMPALRPVSP